MTVSSITGSGGNPNYGATSIAFRTSSTTPVQIGAGGTDTSVLPSPPTTGNILVFWAFTETAGLNFAQWTNSPFNGTVVVGNQSLVTGFLSFGIRCVVPGESSTIAVCSGSFSHWCGVTEWAP
jgi:hypothetical protein